MKLRAIGLSCFLAAVLVMRATAVSAQAAAPQATTADPVASTLKDDLQKALLTTTHFDGLTVKAQKIPTGLWVLDVAANGVGWNTGTTDDAQHAEATVAAGWYDAENKLMGNMVQEQSFKRVIPGGDAIYSLPVVVPAGAVRLRFVVRDALNGHMGTVDLPVQAAASGE